MSDPWEQKPGAGWQEIQETSDERSWGPRLIIAGLALLAAAIFIAQNNEPTETQFLFLSGEPRLFNVILVSMLLGAALGQIVPIFIRRRRKKKPKDTDPAKPPSSEDKPS